MCVWGGRQHVRAPATAARLGRGHGGQPCELQSLTDECLSYCLSLMEKGMRRGEGEGARGKGDVGRRR